MQVRPKKSLGQHFLQDKNIAGKIVSSLTLKAGTVLEIGPGTGVLSHFLINDPLLDVYFIETDRESVAYLKNKYPEAAERIIHDDFLSYNLREARLGRISIIGNLPYNISSQIFFRIIEYRDMVDEVVCMIQKEVAERIASPPGSRRYGILSVLLQAYYDIEYLFTVNEHVFFPVPRVKSAVIRLKRNKVNNLACDEKLFRKVVKTAFNQRRKMIRNSLKELLPEKREQVKPYLEQRPEQLSVNDFVDLTRAIQSLSRDNQLFGKQ